MIDPRKVASRLLGAVDWQNEVSGFCRCPGEAMHTSQNGKKDCRVNVDGAPTIFCFHASCAPAVAEAKRRLRRLLAQDQWAVALPDGRTLRSGDILQRDGTVVGRESWGSTSPQPLSPRGEGSLQTATARAEERLLLESLRVHAERFRPELFEFFRWPMAQILEDSPLLVAERDAEDQFRTWLKLWPACSTVWIGDVYSSGRPERATHFRSVAEWYQIGPVMGNCTCGSAFRQGSYKRSNENIEGQRFLVVVGHAKSG